MWYQTKLAKDLALQYPIIQAPMAGGATTVNMVSIVSEQGGLGSIGAGYMQPEDLSCSIKAIKSLTKNPYSVNLFINEYRQEPKEALLACCHAINACSGPVDANVAPVKPPYLPSFYDQIDVLLENKVPIISFTFGIPDKAILKRCRAKGVYVIGTATTLEEAKRLQDSGFNAIVLQGKEAGGHRGSFLNKEEDSLVSLASLMIQTNKSIKVPIIASGGIMNGKAIVNCLNKGASAAQLGTAFLVTEEAGIAECYKKAILQQRSDTTVLTRSFSGKLARGIRNQYVDNMLDHQSTILPYPIQNKHTSIMRQKAKEMELVQYLSLWAGEKVHKSRRMKTKDLFLQLVDECY